MGIIQAVPASIGAPLIMSNLRKRILMPPFETIEVDTEIVACDGGGGVGGHPKVYLNLAPAGSVECPYCSRLYVRRGRDEARAALERN